MISRNVNQINMALTVQKVLAGHKETWSKHKGFTKQVIAMVKQLDTIKEHQQNAEVQTEGVTKDKANAVHYAIQLGRELAGAAYVYAKSTKSEKLKKQFRIPKKSLTNVQGVVTLSRLKDLHANLEAIIGELEDNVTQDELVSFEKAINEFDSQIVNPRKVIIDREQSNSIVAEGVKNLKSIFEDMDNLISKFKNSEFENKYKLARIVIGHSSRKKVKDEPMDDKPMD